MNYCEQVQLNAKIAVIKKLYSVIGIQSECKSQDGESNATSKLPSPASEIDISYNSVFPYILYKIPTEF